MNKNNSIPFVKPARVGNFKIWRGKHQLTVAKPQLSAKDEWQNTKEFGKGPKSTTKVNIEVIHVSNFDGSWQVRIPETFEMFGMISSLYASTLEGAEPEAKLAKKALTTLLSNMTYATIVGNGFYQKALEMCTVLYANPDILRDKKKRKEFGKDVKDLADAFLVWHDKYDKIAKNNEPTDKELHQEDLADDALEILTKESSAENE